MKKTFFILLSLILFSCFLSGCTQEEPEPEFKKPIETLSVVVEKQVIEVGDILNIAINYSPTDTDDQLIYEDYNENILKYEDNKFIAVGVGETVLYIHSASASVREIISIKVMPKETGDEIEKCSEAVETATLIIENYGYNKNSWGFKTNEFNAVSYGTIIGKIGNRYLFITAYDNLAKMSGLEYQQLTVTDYKGNSYKVQQYYKDKNRATGSYEMAIGVFESTNKLGVVEVGNRGTYYQGERLYLYLNYLGTFRACTVDNRSQADAIAPLDASCKVGNYGNIILDSDYKLVGIIAKKNSTNEKIYFYVTWSINEFLESVIKAEQKR